MVFVPSWEKGSVLIQKSYNQYASIKPTNAIFDTLAKIYLVGVVFLVLKASSEIFIYRLKKWKFQIQL